MKKKKVEKYYLVPLILLLTIVPLIVRVHEYSTNFAQFGWYPQDDRQQEFFLYYKAIAIIIIAAAMCVALAYRYFVKKKEFKLCYELIPVAVYAGFTLLSTLFSQYKYFSIHGSSEVFESIWVLLGYCVILFYAYQFINTIEDIDHIMLWLTIGLGVMLVLGVMQAAGHDFFSTQIGKMLITGSTDQEVLDGTNIIFEKGRVFLTLYNPNYVASYFALMIPVEIALLVKNKKLVYRIVYLIMLAASLVCLLASGNRSGIVGFVVTIVLTVILLYKHLLKAWKIVVPVAALSIVIVMLFLSKNNLIIQKFTSLFNAVEPMPNPISEIVTGDEDVAITYLGQEFHVAYEIDEIGNIAVSIKDGNGQDIANTLDQQSFMYTIADERFPGFIVQMVKIEEEIAVLVNADYREWYFRKLDDGSYYYYNVFGNWVKINNAPHVALDFLEQKFEYRGTIWSKTIPMLKDSIIFGTGADTYGVTFPQDDYVEKVYDGMSTAVDLKPHNLYLQIATQSGMLALVAFLVLYIWYFIGSFKLYRKASFQDGAEVIGVGLLLATFTYMIVSFLNDSTVAVAPIFWIMMGMGLAVNGLVKKKMTQLQLELENNGKDEKDRPLLEKEVQADNSGKDEKDSTQLKTGVQAGNSGKNEKGKARLKTGVQTKNNRKGKKGRKK